jgi:uncharacterized protein YegJ (DUF2314 family)
MTEPRPRYFAGDPAEARLERAAEAARQTFRFFWRELSWNYRRIHSEVELAIVRVPLPTGLPASEGPAHELLWMGDIRFDGDLITGTLLVQPQQVPGVDAQALLRIPLGEAVDWLYAADGIVYGAHTVQVARAAMSDEEREAHDQAWGGDFGDPEHVRLWPEHHGPQLPLDALDDAPEHPMSTLVVSEMQKSLRDRPEEMSRADLNGLVPLHREALAGNLAQVRLLLAAGANRDARTPAGLTPLDLAQRMGWPRVIEALQTA